MPLSWSGCGISLGHHVYNFAAASLQEPTNKFETGFPPAELEGQEWYHGWISQETAEERLKMVPYDCFLIRETDQEAHTLSLSVKHQGSISHSLIERYLSGYKIAITQKKFTTLLQLVDFYMTNSISDDPCHQLSSPCPRSSTDGECNGNQCYTEAK